MKNTFLLILCFFLVLINSRLRADTPSTMSACEVSAAAEHCDRILRVLWAKQGTGIRPTVAIQSIGKYGKPAEYDFARKQILIDPKAYQLCMNLRKNSEDALAFLIAHEMVHAYQHEESGYEDLGFFVKMKSLKEWAMGKQTQRKHMESEADVWGAVLCYLSGYEVKTVIPTFIETIYDGFNLKSEDPLYDSKKERMQIARRAQAKVMEAIMMYETATYLSVLQYHDKDTMIYKHLIGQFKSAEFYNNLGLSYLFLALAKIEEPYASLPYPLMLDTETRLDKVMKGRPLSPKQLLMKGINNFDQILRLNPDYLPMRVNRASAFHMLSSVSGRRANICLNRARLDINFVEQYDFRNYEGGAKEASRIRRNATIVSNIIENPTNGSSGVSRGSIEKPDYSPVKWNIDKVDLTNTRFLDQLTYNWKETISTRTNVSISGKIFDNSFLTVYRNEGNGDRVYLQRVTQYIPNGTSRSGLFTVGTMMPIHQRNQFRKSLPTIQGDYFLINDKDQMVYKLTADHKVKEIAFVWVVE